MTSCDVGDVVGSLSGTGPHAGDTRLDVTGDRNRSRTEPNRFLFPIRVLGAVPVGPVVGFDEDVAKGDIRARPVYGIGRAGTRSRSSSISSATAGSGTSCWTPVLATARLSPP